MTLKSFLIAGALTLSSVGFASAKSYSVSLNNQTKAGTADLKPGNYEVTYSGKQAVFTSDEGKSFTVPITVEQGNKKFDRTAVETTQKDNQQQIQEIDLGGSTTELQFAQ